MNAGNPGGPHIGTIQSVAGALDPRGESARDIDDLWVLLLVLGVAVFVLVVGLLVGALSRRGSRPFDSSFPEVERPDEHDRTHARRWIVAGGVVLPIVVIGAVFVATIAAMRAVADNGDDATMTVEVVGHQWWWEVRYPDVGADVTTTDELHIPAGAAVVLELTSADVIHSFWVPSLAGKMDLLPERTNTLTIAADEPGRYSGQCAEFCGLEHANMGLVVIAHEPDRFEEWAEAQR